MDKSSERGSDRERWQWLPQAMPGVAKLMAERRVRLGAAWVAECWRKSVVEKQPGWFFAREGPLAIGTPWDAPELANFAALQVTATQALVLMREPEVRHGANR